MYTTEIKQVKGSQPVHSAFIQPKLKIGAPNDKYEQEADRIANQVVSGGTKVSQNQHSEAIVQRKCTECEEEKLQMKPLSQQVTPLIQTKSNASGQVATDSVSSGIQLAKGNGKSIDRSTKLFMENRFGSDFSNVNIHTDSKAAQLNQQLNARAFTVGNDIFFNKGEYQPNSNRGKHLLAHELTHTVQQKGAEFEVQKQHHHTGTSSSQSIANISEAEKWNIVYDSGIQGLGNGVLWALQILLGFILVLGLITLILGLICPLCIAAVESALATVVFGAAVSTWLTAIIGSIVVGSAINRIVEEYQTVERAVQNATTIGDLQTAGRNWGHNSGEALVEIFTGLAPLIPSIRSRFASLFRRLGRGRSHAAPSSVPNLPPSPSAAIPRTLALDEAISLARRLRNESEWLRELSRIKRLRDLAERNLAIDDFIRNYSSSTGIRIEVVPRHLAGSHRIGPRNWGTFDEAAGRIYIHEDVFTSSHADTILEIAHEVGAAEIGRILGIVKADIPSVTGSPPGIGYLTHVLDMLL